MHHNTIRKTHTQTNNHPAKTTLNNQNSTAKHQSKRIKQTTAFK